MCPNLWWETINTASVELLGHVPLFQQRPSVMGGTRRWRKRECCPFLFWKKISLPIKLCLFVKLEPRKSHDPSNPTVYPDSSVLCLVSDGSALFCCQGGWIDLGWLLSRRAHSFYNPLRTGQCLPHLSSNQATYPTPHGTSKSETPVSWL